MPCYPYVGLNMLPWVCLAQYTALSSYWNESARLSIPRSVCCRSNVDCSGGGPYLPLVWYSKHAGAVCLVKQAESNDYAEGERLAQLKS